MCEHTANYYPSTGAAGSMLKESGIVSGGNSPQALWIDASVINSAKWPNIIILEATSSLNMRGIIGFPPSVCGSWWKPHFIATIIMELSPGVMRAFNEIITKDYLLFFMGLLKGPLWCEAEYERLGFFFLLLFFPSPLWVIACLSVWQSHHLWLA